MRAGTRDPGPMAVVEEPTDSEPDRSRSAGRCGFSPVHLVAELPELVPRAIERGRGQLKLAQALGRFAIEHSPLGDLPSLQPTIDAPVASPGPSQPQADDVDQAVAQPPPPEPTADEPPAPAVPVEHLALPDYDSLSASQVIPRLQGLEPAELEDVRQYETASRSRRTILNKIAQLQSSS